MRFFLMKLVFYLSLSLITVTDATRRVKNNSESALQSRTYGSGALEVLSSLFTDAGVKPVKPGQHKPGASSAGYANLPSFQLQPSGPPSHGQYQPVESNGYNNPSQPNRPVIIPPHQPNKPPPIQKPSAYESEPEQYRPVSEVGKPDEIGGNKHSESSGYGPSKPAVETIDPSEASYPTSSGNKKPGHSIESYPDDDGQESHGCICVPYYQCDNGRIVDDGAGIIDPRIKEPPKKEIPLDGRYQPPYCGTFHVCCSEPETATQLPYTHKCGIRNPSGINRRILVPSSKGESDFGEWPWQVAVLKIEKDVNIFQCGGTLIDSQHVLTVAHCVKAFIDSTQYALKVRLGEWDTQKTTEFLPHEDYLVERVLIHPKFNPNNLWNDIALLKLDRPVNFKPNIDSVCLPTPDEVFEGHQCVTTGWGKNAYKGGHYSNILKEVSLPIISNYDCQKRLRRTRLGPRFRLHDGFMCAGGEEGRDSCKGDGGGPLVCYRQDGTYTLVGIVSWGIDCGQPGHPGVYINVQKYLEWITEMTGNDVKNYWSPASSYPASSSLPISDAQPAKPSATGTQY